MFCKGLLRYYSSFIIIPELPQGQEKLRKLQKLRKNRVFEKKSGSLTKVEKNVRFCLFIFTKFLIFQSF